MDTVSIHQSFLMPATRGVKFTSVDVDGYAVVDNDSLHHIIESIRDTICQQQHNMEGVAEKVSEISDYGVGYSDVAAHITIPLIIALFAFAFPFLFTVISHINNKYESEHITEMFSSEPSYKWFLKGAKISACYLAVVGILSLCFCHVGYQWLMIALDWSSIIVAGGYSVFILWFVGTCIDYNNPQKLIGRVDAKFERGLKKSEAYLKNLSKKEKRNAKEKSSGKRRFNEEGINIGKSYAYYGVEDSRTKCLIELCKYSLKKHDYDLFLSVVLKVDKMPHPEKFYDNQRFLFFDKVIDAYLYCEQNGKVEETLMQYWFSAFNRSERPNEGVIYRMLGKMVKAVMQGRTSIFEQYVQHASYGYSFINHLQIVSYVSGANVNEQKEADKQRLETWLELCEMHYIALAHLFAAGKVEPLRTMMAGKNSGYGRLFPSSGTEILKLFARCKEKQEKDGTFSHYWHLRDVVGESTDPEMLEKFTSLLLLMASEISYQSLNLISESKLKLIQESEGKMADYAAIWLNSTELISQFPQIGGKVFKERFDLFLNQMQEAEKVENKLDDELLLIRVVYCLMKVFCEGYQFKKKGDIYQKAVPEEIKKEVKIMFYDILYGNASGIFDGLTSEDKEDKTNEMPMGELNFMTYKHALMEHEGLYTNEIFNNLYNVFKSRYQFIVYQAIANMKISDMAIPIDEFDTFFENYVGDKGAEYYIIDSDSHMNLFYKMDKKDDGGCFTFHKTYKGAGYKHYDLNVGWYLRDIALLEPFKETLVILKRTDLPTVVNTTNPAGPDVRFKDESNRTKGIAAVSMTVNPNYMIKYNSDAEVLRLRLEPLKRKI